MSGPLFQKKLDLFTKLFKEKFQMDDEAFEALSKTYIGVYLSTENLLIDTLPLVTKNFMAIMADGFEIVGDQELQELGMKIIAEIICKFEKTITPMDNGVRQSVSTVAVGMDYVTKFVPSIPNMVNPVQSTVLSQVNKPSNQKCLNNGSTNPIICKNFMPMPPYFTIQLKPALMIHHDI